MATYVMSDIHGAFDEFKEMLDVISFSDTDKLYILGDVVDRGPDGVALLQYAMKHPRVEMLLGNHEHMCMQFFEDEPDETVIRRWNRNGNFFTLKGFDQITAEEKEEVLEYIQKLPDEVRVPVNGTTYILVHGFLGENTEDRVWNRPKLDTIPALRDDEKLVIGHTPVCEYVCPGSDEDAYVYSRELTLKGDHFRILHAKGFIDIDCCVGYGMSAARLACLRLDDLKEFYVKVRR